jgi:hypothetical protein
MTLHWLLGGTIFAAIYSAFDWLGVGITACVLVALELIHDVQLYRRELER